MDNRTKSRIWQSLKKAFVGDVGTLPIAVPPRVQVVASRTITLPPEQRLPPVKKSSVVVRPIPRPYWREMGWQKSGDEFLGTFRAFDQTFPGRIVHLYDSTWDFFIKIDNPWPKLQAHPKWPCFESQGNGWRKVHWHMSPKSLDSGIQSIEDTLAQALSHRRSK